MEVTKLTVLPSMLHQAREAREQKFQLRRIREQRAREEEQKKREHVRMSCPLP